MSRTRITLRHATNLYNDGNPHFEKVVHNEKYSLCFLNKMSVCQQKLFNYEYKIPIKIIKSLIIRQRAGRWFSPVSSTNTIDRHDITEILLNVALNTITLILYDRESLIFCCIRCHFLWVHFVCSFLKMDFLLNCDLFAMYISYYMSISLLRTFQMYLEHDRYDSGATPGVKFSQLWRCVLGRWEI